MRKMFVCATAAAVATALLGTTAVAQKTEEITVEAARIVTKPAAHQPPGGMQVKDVTLSYGIAYSGLDLASTAGAAELEKRVNDAALQACKEIGRQYPDSTPSDADCAKAAVAKAMVKVHEVVSAASKKPAK
jgi:UrcA family protein